MAGMRRRRIAPSGPGGELDSGMLIGKMSRKISRIAGAQTSGPTTTRRQGHGAEGIG